MLTKKYVVIKNNKMNDITLSTPDGIFSCRVGIIIVKDGKILLVHDEEYGIYYTVGGRIRFGESSLEAAKREAEEELGFCPEIVRPMFIHENFFRDGRGPVHELGIFYLAGIGDREIVSGTALGDRDVSRLIWIDMDSLPEKGIYPSDIGGKIAASSDVRTTVYTDREELF